MFSLVNQLPQRTQLIAVGLILFFIQYTFSIPETIQLLMFGAGLLVTGIPHGAMDHLLYLKLKPEGTTLQKWTKFLSFYLGYALLYGVLWIIDSELAILLFIGISAYHFGEMDLKNVLNNTGRTEKIISTAYGLLFLLNFFLFRYHEVRQILLSFPGFTNSKLNVLNYLYEIRTVFLSASIILVIASLVIYYQINLKSFRRLSYHLLQLALVCLITFQLPIFLGFGFYFNIWHAILSITEIKRSLGWADRSWFYALKKSWFTNLTAFVFIALMFIFFYGDLNRMLAILFISIAILTAPHIQVISLMFNKQHNLK